MEPHMNAPDPIAIEAINLIRFVVWPITLILVVLLFHAPLGRLIDRINDLKIERTDKGLKIALSAASLTKAEAARNPGAEVNIEDIAMTVDEALEKAI
jgi:hypothetical protein